MGNPPRLGLTLATAAWTFTGISFCANPVAAQVARDPNGEAANLGTEKISPTEPVSFNYGVQGALQAAGTPNQAGIGAFIPLSVRSDGVAYLDVLVNANFGDYANYSSIVNTTVAGTTFATSTRLGYRWLNSSRTWMIGINAGYDSRPMATGPEDTGVAITDSRTVFFQQVAAGVEAVSDAWDFNAYALVPIRITEQYLNSDYQGGALDTYGLDVGYSIMPDLKASIGYYYQYGDLGWWGINLSGVGSGVRGRLAYTLANGLTIGANLSYDRAFDTRISADIKYRVGVRDYGVTTNQRKQLMAKPVIRALSATPTNRDARVYD